MNNRRCCHVHAKKDDVRKDAMTTMNCACALHVVVSAWHMAHGKRSHGRKDHGSGSSM